MFPDNFSVSFEYVESKHQAVGTRPDLYPNEVVVFAGNGSVISLMCMFRKDLEIFCPTKCCLIRILELARPLCFPGEIFYR